MLTYKNTTYTSLAILLCFAVVNLVSSNMLSTKGIVVSEKEKEIVRLEKENRYLKIKIEEAVRLADIEDYSKQMGFTASTNTVYMQSNNSFALK